jgi:hypothetical protein
VFYRPFFTGSCWGGDDDGNNKNAADRNKIFFCGGTTHEGGYSLEVLIDEEGNMKFVNENVTEDNVEDGIVDDGKVDDGKVEDEPEISVEYRIIKGDTLLIFSNIQTGDVTNVLRKFDGNLHDLCIVNYFNFILTGKFRREGSNETIPFNPRKSSVTGLFSKGETAFTFFEEFGHSPVPILCFSTGEAYRAIRTLDGIDLFPMKLPEDEDYYMVED